MKVYNVYTPHVGRTPTCVVASSMAEAEKLFLLKYFTSKITKIEVYSENVIH